MPTTRSVAKRNRQNQKRRQRNRAYRTRMRSRIKSLRSLVESGDTEAARARLTETFGIIDATAQKGVIHRNTAARYKSRLSRLVASTPESAPPAEEAPQPAEESDQG